MGHLSLFVYLNSDERLEYLSLPLQKISKEEVKEDEDIEFLKTGLVLDYYKNRYTCNKESGLKKDDLKK